MLLILMLVSVSCMTSQKTSNTAVVPDPIVNGESVVVYDESTDTISMPLWYWKKIVRYIIDTQ